MNQAEAWSESHLGRWHHGVYPDMDTLTGSIYFGGSSHDPDYFVSKKGHGEWLEDRNRHEIMALMLCKNIRELGEQGFVESATHYEEVGE